MGGKYRNVRNRTTKNKSYGKVVRTRCRPRDLDQVQDDIKKQALIAIKVGGIENIVKEINEDLPGLGQYPCIVCARHFIDEATLNAHLATKPHGKRLKMTQQKQYSHDEADFGAGKTKEILPPAHPK